MNTENDALDEVSQEGLPTANIIVAGITGTGKSTLINAVFGAELAKTGTGRPVTENINEYENGDIPIHIWDTVGLELDSKKTKESIKSIKEAIANKAAATEKYDRVHAIWYCINSGSNRYQGAELEFIKELYSLGVPFIIVLSQCYGTKKKIEEFEGKIKDINASERMDDIKVVRVLAQDYEFEIDEDQSVLKKAFGLDELVEVTLKGLPEFIKSGFVAAQQVNKFQKRVECENIIFKYVLAAQGETFQNFPVVRLFTTDSRIRKMFRDIGMMYNVFLEEEKVDYIINHTNVKWENRFSGLTFAKLSGFNDKISNLLDLKKSEGYEVMVDNLPINNRVGRLIAYFGYVFVDSIEVLWEEVKNEELKEIDQICDRLVGIINRKLEERNRRERHA